jgi:hypothetical protein
LSALKSPVKKPFGAPDSDEEEDDEDDSEDEEEEVRESKPGFGEEEEETLGLQEQEGMFPTFPLWGI